jgi:hypothetical protein
MLEPSYIGLFGKVWDLDVSKFAGEKKHTTCGGFIVSAPYAHPHWQNYFCSVIHLRDVPGLDPATIYLEGATHEMLLWAMNPKKGIAPILEYKDDNVMSYCLSPVNFGAQFVSASDQAAHDLILIAMKDVADARLNPDTDFRSQWVLRFGNNMMKSYR